MEIGGARTCNAAVSSVGKGGGFLGFGASNAFADVVNNVTVKVARRRLGLRLDRCRITALAMTTGNGEAVNRTGGLIAGADTDVDARDRLPVRPTSAATSSPTARS